MQRKSYITQHPHQEIRRGRAPYASSTAMKSSTNEIMDFQTLANHLQSRYSSPLVINHNYSDDEDSDERTIYFAKDKKKNQLR